MSFHPERWFATDEGWYDPHQASDLDEDAPDVHKTLFGHLTIYGSSKNMRMVHDEYWERIRRKELDHRMLWFSRLQIVNREFLNLTNV